MRVDERAMSWSYGSRFKCPWHRNEPYVKLGALFTDVLLQQFAHSPLGLQRPGKLLSCHLEIYVLYF